MDTKDTAEKKKIDGVVADAQIAMWKQQAGKVMAIEVEDDDTTYVGYFRRPTMETMSAVNKLTKNDEIKGSMTMFDNCWLGGSETMKTDAIIKMAALAQLSTIFNTCASRLKNL